MSDITLNFKRAATDTKRFAKYSPTNIGELGEGAYLTLGIPLDEAGDVQAFDVPWVIKPVKAVKATEAAE